MKKTTPYSIHTFMFPFSWNYILSDNSQHKHSYSARTNLVDFDRLFTKCDTLKRNIFEINKDSGNYNEYTYFHEFVRHTIYDTGQNKDLEKNEVLYYDLDGKEGDYFQIQIGEENSNTLRLAIDNICIHVFSTGVGIISYNLSNFDYATKEEVLQINEYGRRIYPQFIGEGWNVNAAKVPFMANEISGQIGNRLKFFEDFSAYKGGVNIGGTFIPPAHISAIFGYAGQEKIGDTGKAFVFDKKSEKKGTIRISKLTDDRMFFLCYMHDREIANSLGKFEDATKFAYKYENSSFWYAFTFGDNNDIDITIKNDFLMKEHLKDSTYTRWLNSYQIDSVLIKERKVSYVKDNAIYGVTKDSFVCIGGWEVLITHMQTMYYQMAILCLAQRSSVLRFSYEIGLITNLLEDKTDPTASIKDLSKNYIQFVNKIYFREVTSQIQGIELYDHFHKAMKIERDVKALEGEINNLHTYISVVEQSNLGKIDMWFLPAGIIVGILGSNIFTNNGLRVETWKPDWVAWGWIGIVIITSLAAIWALSKFLNRKIR